MCGGSSGVPKGGMGAWTSTLLKRGSRDLSKEIMKLFRKGVPHICERLKDVVKEIFRPTPINSSTTAVLDMPQRGRRKQISKTLCKQCQRRCTDHWKSSKEGGKEENSLGHNFRRRDCEIKWEIKHHDDKKEDEVKQRKNVYKQFL